MLLDLKDEEKAAKPLLPIASGIALFLVFTVQLIGVLSRTPDKTAPPLDPATLASAAAGFAPTSKIATTLGQGKLPDVHLIGHTLFTDYNMPLQVLGVLLLVATVGVVVLSKRQAD
jgi:NADH-quinone oxidoreductase subunit J